jgi:hypothetical protein
MLFLRTGTLAAVEVGDEAGVLQAAVSRAVELHEANRTFLTNHQCYLRKFWPGDEIEYKLTLKEPVDIYDLTVEFRNAVSVGPLSGYLWEYRDDFQQWDFDNYLYEILGPEEAGYISFIPDSLGTVVVKRKWFTEGAVRRRGTPGTCTRSCSTAVGRWTTTGTTCTRSRSSICIAGRWTLSRANTWNPS